MFFKRFFNFYQYWCAFILLLSVSVTAAPLSYYLPGMSYNESIATPKSVLGVSLGEQHLRHDQLVKYITKLAQQSNRIQLTSMGHSYQHRDQLLLTISSPENLANLDTILNNRDRKNYVAGDEPVIVWLGYSVHGDEISGTHAAMAVAYHLAASKDKSVANILNNTIIVIEPSVNPDGMDRFANWVATYKGMTENSDPAHIEHHQGWPSGRTNHFWFDLNRDWLLLSQQESQNRLKYFHYYQPNVLGDFHEMGANGTYFFQPGIPSRTHPLTPKENTSLTGLLATYHAKALDEDERLYYSEENFDDFYYGKGSTYPDVNGSVGILFEQASSRGAQQSTINGLLTFEYGIKNQVLTSLSTIKGAYENQDKLKSYREGFYKEATKLAKKEKFWGYLLHESKDSYRLNAFLNKLSQHQIDAFPLTSDFRLNAKVYEKENSYFVPLDQSQFRLVQAIFNTQTHFEDNTFYDVSGWTMPMAMNIEFAPVNRSWGLKLAEQAWTNPIEKYTSFDSSAYAYAIEWHHFQAPKLLNILLANNITVKVATKPFTGNVQGKEQAFKAGTLMVLPGIQAADDWKNILERETRLVNVPSFGLSGGLTVKGIDLGSNSFSLIKPRQVMLLGGKDMSQYEAGEIRYYLDNQLSMPVSVVETGRFMRVDLTGYTHIILVDGQYGSLSEKITEKLDAWIQSGGTVVAQKRAANYLAEHDILQAHITTKKHIDALFDTSDSTYLDKESLAGKKRIAGAIFAAELDLGHPLTYGFDRSILPMFKNSTIIIDKPEKPFMAVATFQAEPLLSGYTDQNIVNRIAYNAPIVAHNYGKGRVIASSENLAFRGYWYGTAKLLSNAIFFDRAFSVSMKE